jgi:hypothetical protein
MSEKQIPKDTRPPLKDPNTRVFWSGEEARKLARPDGHRMFLPFRITLEVQLSPLSLTSDKLEFFLYQERAEFAIERAMALLKTWYVQRKEIPNGFPKPTGRGQASRLKDGEFRRIFRSARERGKTVYHMGEANDPVAFHIKPAGRIFVPA